MIKPEGTITYMTAAWWAVIGCAWLAIGLAVGQPGAGLATLAACWLVSGYALGRRHAELLFLAAINEAALEDAQPAEVVEKDKFENGASCLTSIHQGVDGEGYEWHSVALYPDGEVAATRVSYDQQEALRNHRELSAKVG